MILVCRTIFLVGDIDDGDHRRVIEVVDVFRSWNDAATFIGDEDDLFMLETKTS